MRGTTGVIERVEIIDEKVNIQVIEEEKTVGICCSGLIDAIAEMLRVGIINFRGKMLTNEEYLKKCEPNNKQLSNNLCKIDNTNVFILYKNQQSGTIKYITPNISKNAVIYESIISSIKQKNQLTLEKTILILTCSP